MLMSRSDGFKYLLAIAAVFVACTPAAAQHVLDGCIFYDNLPVDGEVGGCATFSGQQLIANFLYNDTGTNPLLAAPYNDPYNTPGVAPSFMPALASIALGSNDDVASPILYPRECDELACTSANPLARIRPVCWRGAMAPASYDPVNGGDWTSGWTYYNFDGTGRTDLPPAGYPQGHLIGSYFGNITIGPDREWWIEGKVLIEAGASITILPGTVIRGVPQSIATLVIKRGGKIYAVGTSTAPIIFTSGSAPGSMLPGDFGGLVVTGRAIANCADCWNGVAECSVEGFTPAENVKYCGPDDCDDSGTLRYVRVEYAGYELAPANELNCFVFAGVGSRTNVDYCQAFRGSDDLFEWFGGSVFCTHLYGAGGQDDGLDWQMGFRGGVQFAIIQQWADGSSERGIEADNNEFGFDRPCRSNPFIANVSLVRTTHSGFASAGVKLRRGTDAHIYNSIVMGQSNKGVDIDDNATCARGFRPQGSRINDGQCPTGTIGLDSPITSSAYGVRVFPNPLVGAQEARFSFDLPKTGHTRLSVYDPAGRTVADLVNAELHAGPHDVVWNIPGDRPAGTYFYRLQNGTDVRTGHIVTIR
jgi:hypothetical protein